MTKEELILAWDQEFFDACYNKARVIMEEAWNNFYKESTEFERQRTHYPTQVKPDLVLAVAIQELRVKLRRKL